MITISINEKPFIEAKDVLVEAAKSVKEKANVAGEFLSKNISINHSKVAYYSSIASNICSYQFGFMSVSSLLLKAITVYSLPSLNTEEERKLPAEDKKMVNTAIANLSLDLFTSLFNVPSIKLLGTTYNLLSEYINISVKSS